MILLTGCLGDNIETMNFEEDEYSIRIDLNHDEVKFDFFMEVPHDTVDFESPLVDEEVKREMQSELTCGAVQGFVHRGESSPEELEELEIIGDIEKDVFSPLPEEKMAAYEPGQVRAEIIDQELNEVLMYCEPDEQELNIVFS